MVSPISPVVTPAKPYRPSWVGTALAGWATFNQWIFDYEAEIDLIFALGIRRIAIPYSLFTPPSSKVTTSPPPTTALTRLIQAVQYALSKGMNVYIQVHVDGFNQMYSNYPWAQKSLYLATLQDMAIALQKVWLTRPATATETLTIVVGNELTGANPLKDWPTIMTLYNGADALIPQAVKAVRQHLPGAKVYAPYMGDEQAGYLAAGMTQAGMTPEILLYGGEASPAIEPLIQGIDIHYLLETMVEALKYIPGATAAILLAEARKMYGNLPIGMGEFSGVPLNPDGSEGTKLDLAMVEATVALEIECYYWQWYLPGGVDLCLKGNAPLQAALGFGPEISSSTTAAA
jgi:hypothetical protein